jgi:hypothetical protein
MLNIPATFAIQAHVIPPSAGNLAGGLNFSSQEFEDMTGPFGNDAASDSLSGSRSTWLNRVLVLLKLACRREWTAKARSHSTPCNTGAGNHARVRAATNAAAPNISPNGDSGANKVESMMLHRGTGVKAQPPVTLATAQGSEPYFALDME